MKKNKIKKVIIKAGGNLNGVKSHFNKEKKLKLIGFLMTIIKNKSKIII